MRKIKVKPTTNLLSLALMLMCNAYANTEPPDLGASDSQCRATYALDDGTLSIPCVKVLNPVEGPQFYAAELQQIPDTEPLQFSVTQTAENNEVNQDDSCVATYLVESGEFQLPCVDRVNLSGEVESADMVFKTISADSSNLSWFVVEETSFSSQLRRYTKAIRKSCPSSSNYKGSQNWANLTDYGYANPLDNFVGMNQTGTFFTNPKTGYSYGTHLGTDYGVKNLAGANVYSICDGSITSESVDYTANRTSKGRDKYKSYFNSRVIVRCDSSNASFLAIYGHVDNALSHGKRVSKGDKIAEIAKAYWCAKFDQQKNCLDPRRDEDNDHLHFGIKVGSSVYGNLPSDWGFGIAPANASYRSVINNGFRDPMNYLCENAISSASGSTDIKLSSSIQISPHPIVQGSPVTVKVNITNNGSRNFVGNFAAAIHSSSGRFVGDIGRKNNQTIRAGKTEDFTFYKSNVTWAPGSYQLQIKYESQSAGIKWDPIPSSSYYYTNPVNVQIQAGKVDTKASQYIDKCIAKYRNYFGSKRGNQYTCDTNYYCQNTTGGSLGKITQIRIHKTLANRNFYYYGYGNWWYASLSYCD
ncbi:MAG TPA: hypothetical protein EYP59_16605 [Thiotrichaceae bacterium]|nr:hypothetical protein [Thiotrichaceae bacterium]